MELLQPKHEAIKLPDGSEKVFVLSKFPAIAGREIITQYPMTAAPKVGDYATNEALMLKLMGFVGVEVEPGKVVRLSTRELVNNHVPDFETLMRIEWAMMEYNCSFFARGKISGFFDALAGKLRPLILQTLTDLQEQSSRKGSQP